MDPRYYVFVGAAVLGALLGLVLRLRTIVNGVIVIFLLGIAGMVIASKLGEPNVTFAFGVASMAIPFLGAVLVAAAGVVQLLLKMRTPTEAPHSGQDQSERLAAVEKGDSRAVQTPNKSLEQTRDR